MFVVVALLVTVVLVIVLVLVAVAVVVAVVAVAAAILKRCSSTHLATRLQRLGSNESPSWKLLR